MSGVFNKNNGNNNKNNNVLNGFKQNKSNAKNDNKTKTCDNNVVVIDLVSSDGSVVSPESEVETEVDTEVDELTETEEQDEEEDTEEAEDSEEDLDFFTQEVREPKKKPKLSATFCGSIIGDKNPLYSVHFNTYLPEGHNYFATVGSNRVTVFECPNDGSIRLVDCFGDFEIINIKVSDKTSAVDKKKSKSEDFYTCCWNYDELTGNPLVISGGQRGVIRIIDCKLKTYRHLCGHGNAINDLKVSPYDHNLLLSSSEDHSLRLWNLKTSICVAKFGGDSGHRDQVICADFYLLSDKYFVSTGMDHSIKVWSLAKEDMKNAIQESYEYEDTSDKSFPMRCQHFPVFTTRKIHSNYIDCVQFFGKYLLSKSCDNEIILSKPNLLDTEKGFPDNRISEEITQLGSFELIDTSYWFIKFSMDFEQTLLSVGSNKGLVYVWDMAVDDPFDYEPLVLERKKCKAIIRQTSFSRDGKVLICVCDDSSIWRWNITKD